MNSRTSDLLLLCLLVALCGCAGETYGPRGTYHQYYESDLSSISIPAPRAVEELAGSATGHWTFPLPIAEVLPSVIQICSQYPGVLGERVDPDGSRTILVLAGRSVVRHGENFIRDATFGGFLDRWLAISLLRVSENLTKVAVVGMPSTGELVAAPPLGRSVLWHLQVQLYSTRDWIKKYGSVDWASRRSPALAPRYRSPSGSSSKDLSRDEMVGGWIEKQIKTSTIAIFCPEVETVLAEVIKRLHVASGSADRDFRITIISTPQLEAFALPNGSIVVSSGLLDGMDNVDQLAAVLAHEYDHVVHRDVAHKIASRTRGERGAATLQAFLVVATSFTPVLMPAAQNVAQSFVLNLSVNASQAAGRMVAAHVDTELFANFSFKTESRADENGDLLAVAAGFQQASYLSMLEKLQAAADERDALLVTEKSHDPVYTSNLVNMEPGLPERLRLARERLAAHQGRTE